MVGLSCRLSVRLQKLLYGAFHRKVFVLSDKETAEFICQVGKGELNESESLGEGKQSSG